jgi:hypothetical protein
MATIWEFRLLRMYLCHVTIVLQRRMISRKFPCILVCSAHLRATPGQFGYGFLEQLAAIREPAAPSHTTIKPIRSEEKERPLAT